MAGDADGGGGGGGGRCESPPPPAERGGRKVMNSTTSAGTARPVVCDIGVNKQNATPIPIKPNPKLSGVLGAREPSLVH
ncbi:hypothetical protein, partial [Nocardia cyriacigeorgica]|uniref:hypothetical protein n=1 Tax=Nocardia cyriacigeorgica TaxID=135487 RepID=UPI002455A766